MTHVGPHQVWARIHDPGATAGLVKVRLEWFTGDATRPTLNRVIETPLVGDFALVNLGEIIPRRARVGRQTWIGRVLAKADTAGADLNIDKLYMLPTGEGYGRIVASDVLPMPTAFSARDEFDQSAGALAGKTLPVGGTWAGAGDADDFAVEASGHTAQRSVGSDALNVGRFAIAGSTSYTDTAVQIEARMATFAADQHIYGGPVARYVDANNWLWGCLTFSDSVPLALVRKNVAGVITEHSVEAGRLSSGAWYSMVLLADAAGRFAFWWWQAGSMPGVPALTGRDSDLATGGVLASGKPGFGDYKRLTEVPTRNYDNFAAWVPESDAVLYPSRTAELRTDGFYRQSSDGTASAPIVIWGDLPRMPASSAEGRKVEVFLETSRGDLARLPDSGIDSLAARVLHRPSWLFPRRS